MTTRRKSLRDLDRSLTTSRDLRAALYALDGLPVGGWAQTAQAMRQLRGELPFRAERTYTLDDVIQRYYTVDSNDRYQLKGTNV